MRAGRRSRPGTHTPEPVAANTDATATRCSRSTRASRPSGRRSPTSRPSTFDATGYGRLDLRHRRGGEPRAAHGRPRRHLLGGQRRSRPRDAARHGPAAGVWPPPGTRWRSASRRRTARRWCRSRRARASSSAPTSGERARGRRAVRLASSGRARRASPSDGSCPSHGGVQATPAGLFKSFGGLNDLLLVGTQPTSANAVLRAQPDDRAPTSTRPSATRLRDRHVLGMAVVDYAANRVYFGTPPRARHALGPRHGPERRCRPQSLERRRSGIPSRSARARTGAPVSRNGRRLPRHRSGAVLALHSLRVSDGNLVPATPPATARSRASSGPTGATTASTSRPTTRSTASRDDGTASLRLRSGRRFRCPRPSIVAAEAGHRLPLRRRRQRPPASRST